MFQIIAYELEVCEATEAQDRSGHGAKGHRALICFLGFAGWAVVTIERNRPIRWDLMRCSFFQFVKRDIHCAGKMAKLVVISVTDVDDGIFRVHAEDCLELCR